MKNIKDVLREQLAAFDEKFNHNEGTVYFGADSQYVRATDAKRFFTQAITSSLLAYREAVKVEGLKIIETQEYMFFASSVLHSNKLKDGRDTWEISKRDIENIFNAALQKVNQLSKEFFNE